MRGARCVCLGVWSENHKRSTTYGELPGPNGSRVRGPTLVLQGLTRSCNHPSGPGARRENSTTLVGPSCLPSSPSRVPSPREQVRKTTCVWWGAAVSAPERLSVLYSTPVQWPHPGRLICTVVVSPSAESDSVSLWPRRGRAASGVGRTRGMSLSPEACPEGGNVDPTSSGPGTLGVPPTLKGETLGAKGQDVLPVGTAQNYGGPATPPRLWCHPSPEAQDLRPTHIGVVRETESLS